MKPSAYCGGLPLFRGKFSGQLPSPKKDGVRPHRETSGRRHPTVAELLSAPSIRLLWAPCNMESDHSPRSITLRDRPGVLGMLTGARRSFSVEQVQSVGSVVYVVNALTDRDKPEQSTGAGRTP